MRPVNQYTIAHETDHRRGGLVPYRLRIARQEFHGLQLNMDRDGWRTGKANGLLFDDWSPTGFRFNVFLLGGSAAYGYSVDDDGTIAAHLEQLGREDGFPDLRVYNLGQMGYQIHDEVNVLVDLLRQRRIPKVVVFYDGANEAGRGIPGRITDNVLTPYVEGDYSYWEVRDLVEAGENVQEGKRLVNVEALSLAKVVARVKNHFWSKGGGRGEQDGAINEKLAAHARQAAEGYLRNVQFIANLSRGVGFQVLFVLQPMGVCLESPLEYQFPMLAQPVPWQINYYRGLYAEIQTQVAGLPGLSIINLCDAVNRPVAKGRKPFNTQIHLNSEGNKVIAEILLDHIKSLSKQKLK